MTKKPPQVDRLQKTVFAIVCEDGPNGERLRDEHLGGHIEYVEQNHDRYLVAGPMMMPGETKLVASLFLIYADSKEDAETFMRGDPYISYGVYETITYRVISPACGAWMGGVIWDSIEGIRERQKIAANGVT